MRYRSRCVRSLMCLFLVSCSDDPTAGNAEAAGAVAVAGIQDPLAAPASATLNVTSDTSIRASNPNLNFGTTPTLDINRGLLRVDPTALSAVVSPTDYVVSAKLRVTLVPSDSRKAQRNLDVHRVLKQWTENQATWNCAVDTNTGNRQADCSGASAWRMTGTDAFVSTASSRTTIPASRTGTLELDVTSDVRSFLNGSAANYGWLLKTGVGNGSEVADLASRESTTPPALVLSVQRCSASACDDHDACTVDSCSTTGTCVNAAAPAGTTCDDGNACTIQDQCAANGCAAGSPAAAGTACGSGLVCNATSQCVTAPAPMIVINEVRSQPPAGEQDFVELYNQGSSVADISGWSIRDNDDTHVFTIPAGTTIPAGGYRVYSELPGELTFGLGGADSARLFAPNAALKDSYSWTSHASTSYARCPNGTGAFKTSGSVTKNAANDCAATPPPASTADVIINEIESQPAQGEADFIELYNKGTTVADVSGWSLRDNDDTHVFTIPAGTTIAAGSYLVYGELTGQLTFGLGSGDSARLFDATTTLRDSYVWTAHAGTTYGRCPNGTGTFTTTTNATRGAANDCSTGPTFAAWPGAQTISTADNPGTWTSNLSGVTYQPASSGSPALLWAVQNSPAKLYRLEKSGSVWVSGTADNWSTGKELHYPSGAGAPDAEGITKPDWAAPFVYVATERDGSGASRLSILRFDTSAAGSILNATHEWNLTATLPAVGSNLGLEGIAYVPDDYLVQAGLRDLSTSQLYNPSAYPDHGAGLFLVGVEADGMIYAFALDHTSSTFTRIAAFASGLPQVMDLAFDRDQDTLFAYCDNSCNNRATLLAVQSETTAVNAGSFYVGATYNRPTGLPADMNNEGITIAPESDCTGGQKAVFWTDDGATGGNSLRVGSINCGSLF